MKIISKKISLTPYISKINGTLDSYNEYGVKQSFSTYDETKMNNYGMFPLDVICPKDKCNSDNDLILSYPTLMERYYFCKHYKEMLKYDNCEDGGYYLDAVTYYYHNFKYQTEELKQEYLKLDNLFNEYGGDDFLTWCDNILYGGNVVYSDTAHILIPILFTNTIDDLGEFSIFCDEWEEGVEYQEGDVAIYEDEIWLKNNKGYGSDYDEKYKELNFSTSGWSSYTDAKLSAITNTDTTYSVKNGKVFYDSDVNANNMADKYDIITNGVLGFYVINDKIYKPFKAEYIYYNGKYILVQNCDNFVQLNMKYCYIEGQKIFSKINDVNEHYFIRDNNIYNINNDKNFIEINGELIVIDSNKITINNITYNKIDSYSIIEGKKYYILNNEIITFKRNDEGTEYTINNTINTDLGKKETNADKNTIGYNIISDKVYVYKPYYEYSTSKISGYTESKLSSLLNYRRFKDDMGNELPGALKEGGDGIIISPKENDILEIPYKVGNVSDLTVIEYETDGETPKTFFGNKLTNITYYDTIGETKTKITDLSVLDKKDEVHNVSCELEYQMGAIMNSSFEIISDGVRYKDTVSVTKESCDYKLDDVSSFILYYYKFEYYNTFDKYNEYCDTYVKTNKAYFEHDLIYSGETKNYREKYDGMIYAPVFREEYKIGSSSLENIQSDIYIDRGFSSSFERHLNLLSVKSMEALENFGNGFYNIIES